MKNRINFKFDFGIESIVAFLLSFTVISTILGTIVAFLGLKWNFIVLLIIIIISLCMSCKIKNIFALDSTKKKVVLLAIVLVLGIIYSRYSPILEVRQDPAVYMMKSMNLINYGATYSPTDNLDSLIEQGILEKEDYSGYAAILNGTRYEQYGLETDFYAGGAFINASLGLINKDLSFYGVTLIAILIGILLYYILLNNKYLANSPWLTSILVITFMISPVNTWFFRGTYSEGISCLFFMLILYILSKVEKLTLSEYIFIASIGVAAYFDRLDYIIILLLVVFILTYSNKKYGFGCAVVAISAHFIAKNTYTIYYERISNNDFKVIKLAYILIVLSFLMGLIFNYIKNKRNISIESIIEHKFFKCLLILLVVAIIMLSFRSMLPERYYEMSIIHEKYMRTYNEEIFKRFFMVFPAIIIIFGILNLPKLFLNKDLSLNAKIILMGTFIPYCYYLYRSGNSPQLYWNLRRYVYIILPVLFISFVYCFNYISMKINKYIVLIIFLLMVNLQVNSGQIVEFNGLLDSVKNFEKYYCKDDAIFLYDKDLKYDLSSIISYCKNEFVPVEDAKDLNIIRGKLKNKKVYYITDENIALPAEKISISYVRLGEDYNKLPTEVQEKEIDMKILDLSEFEKITNSKIIYPNENNVIFGFYDGQSWTKDTVNIYTNVEKQSNDVLVIEQNNHQNPLLDRDELKINVTANDMQLELIKQSQDKTKLYFKIPTNIKTINNICITTNTFNPKSEGINTDGRDLGISIKAVYLAE